MKTLYSLLILFVLVAVVPANIAVKHMTGHATTEVASVRPYITLINEGAEIIDLSPLVVEYYINDETATAQDLTWELYHCALGSVYEINFYDLEEVEEQKGRKANIKCEISFTSPITLQSGATLEMRHGIFPTSWPHIFKESDDWSYVQNQNYTYNENIIVRNSLTGDILYGNSFKTVNPRPYAVTVNWLGEHTLNEFDEITMREGDAFLNSEDGKSYVFYQEEWTLLTDLPSADLNEYATKEYVNEAVKIAPNSIGSYEISNNLLSGVNADLLDGLHANEIISAAATGSTPADIQFIKNKLTELTNQTNTLDSKVNSLDQKLLTIIKLLGGNVIGGSTDVVQNSWDQLHSSKYPVTDFATLDANTFYMVESINQQEVKIHVVENGEWQNSHTITIGYNNFDPHLEFYGDLILLETYGAANGGAVTLLDENFLVTESAYGKAPAVGTVDKQSGELYAYLLSHSGIPSGEGLKDPDQHDLINVLGSSYYKTEYAFDMDNSADGNSVFISASNGIYRKVGVGSNWEKSHDQRTQQVKPASADGSVCYFGYGGKIFVSKDATTALPITLQEIPFNQNIYKFEPISESTGWFIASDKQLYFFEEYGAKIYHDIFFTDGVDNISVSEDKQTVLVMTADKTVYRLNK